MDKEKFSAMANGLTSLITDYNSCKNDLAKLQLKELIVSYADNFAKIYRGEKKSEMPCNCKPKTLQEIIDEAKAELTDSNTFAAIVFRTDN